MFNTSTGTHADISISPVFLSRKLKCSLSEKKHPNTLAIDGTCCNTCTNRNPFIHKANFVQRWR